MPRLRKDTRVPRVVFSREAVVKLLETLARKCKSSSATLMLNLEAQDILNDQSFRWIEGSEEKEDDHVVERRHAVVDKVAARARFNSDSRKVLRERISDTH